VKLRGRGDLSIVPSPVSSATWTVVVRAVSHFLSYVYFAPRRGAIPLETHQGVWYKQTRVPVLRCGVICVIISSAAVIELRLVTDGQTEPVP